MAQAHDLESPREGDFVHLIKEKQPALYEQAKAAARTQLLDAILEDAIAELGTPESMARKALERFEKKDTLVHEAAEVLTRRLLSDVIWQSKQTVGEMDQEALGALVDAGDTDPRLERARTLVHDHVLGRVLDEAMDEVSVRVGHHSRPQEEAATPPDPTPHTRGEDVVPFAEAADAAEPSGAPEDASGGQEVREQDPAPAESLQDPVEAPAEEPAQDPSEEGKHGPQGDGLAGPEPALRAVAPAEEQPRTLDYARRAYGGQTLTRTPEAPHPAPGSGPPADGEEAAAQAADLAPAPDRDGPAGSPEAPEVLPMPAARRDRDASTPLVAAAASHPEGGYCCYGLIRAELASDEVAALIGLDHRVDLLTQGDLHLLISHLPDFSSGDAPEVVSAQTVQHEMLRYADGAGFEVLAVDTQAGMAAPADFRNRLLQAEDDVRSRLAHIASGRAWEVVMRSDEELLQQAYRGKTQSMGDMVNEMPNAFPQRVRQQLIASVREEIEVLAESCRQYTHRYLGEVAGSFVDHPVAEESIRMHTTYLVPAEAEDRFHAVLGQLKIRHRELGFTYEVEGPALPLSFAHAL